MVNKTINTAKGEIEYSIYGEGQPIIFIHGGHSNSLETLIHKGINPKEFTLITPSRPGYGKTPLGKNLSPIESAELINSLMNELNLKKSNIIGISAGGPTAIAIASFFPDRVRNLILASAVSKQWLHPNDAIYKKAHFIFHPKRERYTWGLIKLLFTIAPNFIGKLLFSELSLSNPKNIKVSEFSELRNMVMQQQSGSGFIADINHSLNESQISNVNAPTLIIHSKNDRSVDISHARFAHSKIIGSRLIELDNEWGHLIWIGNDSSKNIAYITEFLKN